MTHFQIGQDGLGRLYKAVAEKALDRIIGERLAYPSPFHDRIDLAHARMFALSPAAGEVPSRNLAVEALRAAGVDHEEILDVVETIDVYRSRFLVSDGQLAVQLKASGFPATAENLARARMTATAAMAQACLTALSSDGAETGGILGVPLPPAMAQFGSLTPTKGQPAPAPTATSANVEPPPVTDGVIDGPISVVAEAVITRRLEEGLWDSDRAREVRATINLFIGANGDVPFATIRQHHLSDFVGMMGKLPKKYNHFMVKGHPQPRWNARSAKVASHPDTTTITTTMLRLKPPPLAAPPRSTSFPHLLPGQLIGAASSVWIGNMWGGSRLASNIGKRSRADARATFGGARSMATDLH